MIAALSFIFLGALTLVEQDVTDDLFPAYRQADLDRDGKLDLILSSAVYLQRDGGFSQSGRVEFPDTGPQPDEGEKRLPYCDVWKDTLYLCTPEQLLLFYWENNAWKIIHTQPVKWAGAFPESSLERSLTQEQQRRQRVNLSGFLHDLNGDGVPEIVLAAQDGLHCYVRKEQGYADAARLDILPKMHSIPALQPPEILWPAAARSPVFPECGAECEYVFRGNQVTVFDRERTAADEICYHTRQTTLDSTLSPMPGGTVETVTRPMPMQFSPARIGKDGHVDYAGVTREDRESTVISNVLCSYRLTVDDGKTFVGTRAAFFWTRDPFLDFNQDGNLDIAVETTTLLEGGVKETVARVMTEREVDGEIRIYLQEAPGVLPTQPNIVFRFTRTMENPLAFGGWLPHFGQFSLRGDFNGDGRRDLLLPTSEDDVAIHLFNGKSFDKAPACSLSTRNWGAFEVADIDGDGRSDVFFEANGLAEDNPGAHRLLYLSRESTP